MANISAPTKESVAFRRANGLTGKALIPLREAVVVLAEDFGAPSYEAKTGAKAKVRIIRNGRSMNGNVWRQEVLSRDHKKFEGAMVFLDHKFPEDRRYEDFVGEIVDVTPDAEGLTGTFKVLSEGAKPKFIRGVLREMPHHLGLSVYVWATGTPNAEGDEVVEEIDRAESVDVVYRPSAGGGVISVTEAAKTNKDATPPPVLETVAMTGKEPTVAEMKEEKAPVQESVPATPPAPAATLEPCADKIAADAKIAALEKVVTEKDVQIGDLKAMIEVQKNAYKTATTEIAALQAEQAKYLREKMIVDFVAEKKVTAHVERAFRDDVARVQTITRDVLETALAKWNAFVDTIRTEAAPAQPQAEMATGLPPAPAAPAPAAKAPSAAKESQDYLKQTVFELFGI